MISALMLIWPLPAISGNSVTLDIWIRAFIPKTESGQPGYIQIVHGPNGESWTAIPSPSPLDPDICYLTDQRDFSTDASVTSRIWSHAKLTFDLPGSLSLSTNSHGTGTTHAVKCSTGATICKDQAPTTGMNWTNMVGFEHLAVLDIDAKSSNPCITPHFVAPNIEYTCRFLIDWATSEVKFDGTIRKFPSYEAYISFNSGPTHILFREEPIGTVLNLISSRDVHASVKW